MNLIPSIGPFDYKVYGQKKAFVNRPIEFLIRNENAQINEIIILNPNGSFSSCDISSKQAEGHLSIEFLPEEIGLHEVRIISDKLKRDLFNSFEFTAYDSSNLNVVMNDEAIVGRSFKINADCKAPVEGGNLLVSVEQGEKKIKPSIKQLKNNNEEKKNKHYEITFVPESESLCKVDLEYIDSMDNVVTGNTFSIPAKAIDFIVKPYPLDPLPINVKSMFTIDVLRDKINKFELIIKQLNETSSDKVELEVIQMDKRTYQIFFTPKSIERHMVQIYFDNHLVNLDRPIKIDVYDVSKIVAKMPSYITCGELNSFTVDTTGAGEGNLEVIIKDGYDTLKAQLLKREKRKFEIGFYCERNMKHDIQVIFNGTQIRESPFLILPELIESKSFEALTDISSSDYMVIEGGPLDGLQCGEKMWIIFDSNSAPYFDSQFLVVDDNNYPIKHTKIQQEDGRWKIEFIPISVGVHQIQRIIQIENTVKVELLQKVNVLNYSAQRIVYGYKLYNMDDSVQLVFDAANFRVQDIIAEVKDPNDEVVKDLDCKYLSDYLALKFLPKITGGYLVYFFDRNTSQQIAASPYKIILHEDYKEIIRSSGIYDLTRLSIAANNLPTNYELNQFNVIVYDSQDKIIQNCFYSNKKKDLIIEFITRIEGVHKVFLYINEILVDDNPFLIFVNGDTYPPSSLSSPFSSNQNMVKVGLNNSRNFLGRSSSSYELSTSNSNSRLSGLSTSDSQIISSNYCQAALGHGTILCAKKDAEFHFVINDKNIKCLCVYDPLNEPMPFKLGEDFHENGSIIIVPKLEGAHRIIGLIEGRDFEAQIFVLAESAFESLFDMNNYDPQNLIEKPFVITLKEPNLEVDVTDPFGERVDVRYTGENIATFLPHTTGYFKIFISDYHGPILGSPFYVLIHPEKNLIDSTFVESSGIGDAIRNEETKFTIRNKDLEIDVQIKNPENNLIPLRKKRTHHGFLQIFYTPDMIGLYEIHILKDGLKIIGSPIQIYVSDPNLVKIESLKNEALISEPFSFNIDASKAGEGFIRVNVKDPKMNDILPEINEYDDRKYLIRFLPKATGVYEFSLTFNKYHLIESPFKVNIIESDLSKGLKEKSVYLSKDKQNYLENYSDIEIDIEQINLNSLLNQQNSNNNSNSLPRIEYELNNWNQQLNNTLNKIMEASSNQPPKRVLTPITDTSEEEYNDKDGPIFKGETYIEDVQRLPDGSSHLLLRIEDDKELIDVNDPNKTRGKYKYRFKKLGSLNDHDKNRFKSSIQNDTNIKSDSDSDLSERSKEVVKSVIDNAYKRLNEERESDLDKLNKALEAIDNKNIKNTQIVENPEEFKLSDKRKLFENAAAALSKDNHKKKKDSSFSSSPANSTNGSYKVSDLVKQMNKKEDEKNPLNKNKKGNKNKPNINSSKSDEADDDDDDDDEINVANEEHVIKLTKEKEKKINQEKTVVIEESYVITYKKPTNNDQDAFEIDSIVNEDEMKKSGADEKVNTLLGQSITKLSKEKYKDDNKKENERIVHVNQIKQSSYSPDFSLTAEKFKPEESFQYEYEEVIEQPDNSSHSKSSTGSKNDKDKIRYENTAKKTTKTQKKERFEKVDDLENDRIKKTTIDMTTYLTQDEESKISETIENSKNMQEFSYQNLRDKQNSDTVNKLNNDLVSHEYADSKDISAEANMIRVKSTILESTFDSNENIADYYKLQPTKKDSDINESNATTESSIDNESQKITSPKTFNSLKAKFEGINFKDSQEATPPVKKHQLKKENLPKKIDISKLPIATSTSSSSNPSSPPSSSATAIPIIGKLPRSKVQIYDQEGNGKSFENSNLKKPKIFNKKQKFEDDLPKHKNDNNNDLKNSTNRENENIDLNETDISQPSKKSSRKRQPQTYPVEDNPPDDFLKSSTSGSDHKSSTEDEDNASRKNYKLNNPTQIPRLIEKVHSDLNDVVVNENISKNYKSFINPVNSSLSKNDHQRSRSSTEDEDNYFKRNNRKYDNSSKESLIPKPASDKNFKSLVNKYEQKTTKQESSDGNDSTEIMDTKGKLVKKLPLNIVKLFDVNKDSDQNVLNPSKIPITKDQQETFKSKLLHPPKVSVIDPSSNELEKLKKVSFNEQEIDTSEIKSKENPVKNDKVKKLKSIFYQAATDEGSKACKHDQSSNELEERISDEKIRFFENKTEKSEHLAVKDNIRADQSKSNSRDPSVDKAVKNLVDKYEKKPSTSNKLVTDISTKDESNNNNSSNDENKTSKLTAMSKLINSLIEDSKPIEKTSNADVKTRNSTQKHQDENAIKRLINKYQPTTISEESSPSKDQLKPLKLINPTLENKKDVAQAFNQENGIKKLVDRYEKKINLPETQSVKEPVTGTIKRISNLRLDNKDRLEMLANNDEPNDEPYHKSLNINYKYNNDENSNLKSPIKSNQNIINKNEDNSDNNTIMQNKESSYSIKKTPKSLVDKYQKPEQIIEVIKPALSSIATLSSMNATNDQQKLGNHESSLKSNPINSKPSAKEDTNYRIYSNNSSDFKAVLRLNDENKKEQDVLNLSNASISKMTNGVYSNLENLLEKTKTEIHKKLKDLKASAIKVQLEVENKKKLSFFVTKTSDGQPIDFEPIEKPNDKHVIYFNYDTIVDFSIGVNSIDKDGFNNIVDLKDEETLKAEIEISVPNEYDFQIIRKDTQQPIPIQVTKKNNIYRIKFQPLSVTSYTLKAIKKTDQSVSSKDREHLQMCCTQNAVKSKIKNNFINQIVDKMPYDLIQNGASNNNNIKINVSITNSDQDLNSQNKKSNSINYPREILLNFKSADSQNPDTEKKLSFTVYNPNDLEVNELSQTHDSVSFIINTQNAGIGQLKFSATHSDGSPAIVEQNQLDNYVYSIKILTENSKPGSLNLFLEHDNKIN